MMKFLVNELPYYNDECPFLDICYESGSESYCPRCWDKYKVCSEDNPRECLWLKEIERDDKN